MFDHMNRRVLLLPMLKGPDLAEAIKEMGLNPTSFAKLTRKRDGKPLSQTAIVNLIRMPTIDPEDDTIEAVEEVLKKRCRCCMQYTENKGAWADSDEPAPRKRKA